MSGDGGAAPPRANGGLGKAREDLFAAPFRVRVWCPDCTGQDPMGCFDGGTELLHEKKSPWAVRTFQSVEDAAAAGWEATSDSIYGFDVIDANDVKVASSDV